LSEVNIKARLLAMQIINRSPDRI